MKIMIRRNYRLRPVAWACKAAPVVVAQDVADPAGVDLAAVDPAVPKEQVVRVDRSDLLPRAMLSLPQKQTHPAAMRHQRRPQQNPTLTRLRLPRHLPRNRKRRPPVRVATRRIPNRQI